MWSLLNKMAFFCPHRNPIAACCAKAHCREKPARVHRNSALIDDLEPDLRASPPHFEHVRTKQSQEKRFTFVNYGTAYV
jgi:hypothetical protein